MPCGVLVSLKVISMYTTNIHNTTPQHRQDVTTMYLNKAMLEKPEIYHNSGNQLMAAIASRIHSQFSAKRWWPTGNSNAPLELFTNRYHIIIKREGINVARLSNEPSYRFTEIDNMTFIEHNGWWMPVYLFDDLEDSNGQLSGDPNYTIAPMYVKNAPWLTECSFRAKNGYIEFWYTEAAYPVKDIMSRSMREVSLIKMFRDKYNVEVEACTPDEELEPYGNVMRCRL